MWAMEPWHRLPSCSGVSFLRDLQKLPRHRSGQPTLGCPVWLRPVGPDKIYRSLPTSFYKVTPTLCLAHIFFQFPFVLHLVNPLLLLLIIPSIVSMSHWYFQLSLFTRNITSEGSSVMVLSLSHFGSNGRSNFLHHFKVTLSGQNTLTGQTSSAITSVC